ncbi:hypothetical protein COV04_01500 [Candidatus Uhrbacteria bacterium CG10_big_fil_rev_8_21_14_0_10_48_11]|uniref:Peptidase S11 D-alanyl-D-alanine carboxypeptidase A N-terminal domain-containing protein n=1 Tax=Candidatus Uhrbacteria bacterium CG10_big_fil_rev_8_21_14_0_10_48_11 TaxID=1975037 RepID=A0A2M8LEX7_9BACT|nr:MAG: hypothetical protein COV04_01500 [Candidatus Uhrbacteria bacterium CG10_big_fil_rev_8_21_14_0_10_48_11]
MQTNRRVAITAVTVGVVAILLNVVSFAADFPGVRSVAAIEGTQSVTLPAQRDLYRPPAAPDFLSQLSTRQVYVSVESPVQFPLLRYHADEQVPLASLTKLTSALVALSLHPDWEKSVTILASDRRVGAQQHVYAGEVVTMRDLWTLLLVGSDNDAVIAFIRGLDIPEADFVAKMNELANAMHLTDTTFIEPTGLAPGNISTAREYAVIARRAFAEPLIADPLKQAEAAIVVSGKTRRVYSTDQELKGDALPPHSWHYVTGKTGFIEESGYNVVVLANDGENGEVLAVVLGSANVLSRAEDASQLFDWALGIVKTMPKGETIGNRLLY